MNKPEVIFVRLKDGGLKKRLQKLADRLDTHGSLNSYLNERLLQVTEADERLLAAYGHAAVKEMRAKKERD